MQNRIIKLKPLYNNSLEMSFTAENLYAKHVNNTHEKEVILDFSGINFMSLSFAQEYVYQKQSCDKIIKEINMNDEIKPMLEIVENRQNI